MYVDIQWLIDNGFVSEDSPIIDFADTRIALMQRYVEKATGRVFEERRIKNFVNGGSDKIHFENPIQSVNKIKVLARRTSSFFRNGQDIILKDFDFDIINKFKEEHINEKFLVQFNEDLPEGNNNIWYDMVIGYLEHGETPLLIKKALGKLIQYEFDPNTEVFGRIGVTTERADDHSYSRTSDSAKLDITGDPEIDVILNQYKRFPKIRMDVTLV